MDTNSVEFLSQEEKDSFDIDTLSLNEKFLASILANHHKRIKDLEQNVADLKRQLEIK